MTECIQTVVRPCVASFAESVLKLGAAARKAASDPSARTESSASQARLVCCPARHLRASSSLARRPSAAARRGMSCWRAAAQSAVKRGSWGGVIAAATNAARGGFGGGQARRPLSFHSGSFTASAGAAATARDAPLPCPTFYWGRGGPLYHSKNETLFARDF
jgi:hypothetical protein